jgi:hypothetical protein
VARAGVRSAAVARAALGAVTVAAAAVPSRAQQTQQARSEARVDYLGPSPHALHGGLGMSAPLGTYLRMTLIAAGGTSWADGRSGASFRGDIVGRFSFDPFRERRWGLSAGGGVSLRYDQVRSGRHWRPLLALVIDLEGPRRGVIAPAIQVGLGGGVRAGAIVRRAAVGRR